MSKLKVFFFIFFFCFFFAPQIIAEDGRKQQIEHIETTLRLAEGDIKPRTTSQTVKEAYQALKLSEEIGYQRGVIKAHYIIALSYFYSVDYKLSMQYLTRIENLKGIEKHCHYLTQMHYLKGRIYFMIGLYDMAIEELEIAVTTAGDIKNKNIKYLVLANTYSALARVYYDLGGDSNIDKIDHYLSMSRQSHLLISMDYDYRPLPEYFVMKTERSLRENNLDSARYYVGLMKRYSLDKRYIGLPNSYVTLGNYYTAINMSDSAYYYYRFALKRTHDSGVLIHMPALYQGLSNYFTINHQPDSASFYANKYAEEVNSQSISKLTAAKEVMISVLDENNAKYQTRNIWYIVTIILILIVLGILSVDTYIRKKDVELKSLYGENRDKIKNKINSNFDSLIEAAKSNSPTFMILFKEAYPAFWARLTEVDPALTAAELHLCALTYLNFSTKQIAEIVDIQISSVQARRSRLRRKISLDVDVDFGDFLRELAMNGV